MAKVSGPARAVVADGCPANFNLNAQDIQQELTAATQAISKFTEEAARNRSSANTIRLLKRKNYCVPPSLQILNIDQRERDYTEI